MHPAWSLLLIVAIAWAMNTTAAESLYAASVRSPIGDGSHLIAGNLYTVNLSTGVLYGIAADSSPNYPRSLVTIDVANAEGTLVGNLGASGSDIAFNRSGTLFIWLRETSQLGTVDLSSGRATPLGAPGPASETGGVAIDHHGRAYLAATGASGSLDMIDAWRAKAARTFAASHRRSK